MTCSVLIAIESCCDQPGTVPSKSRRHVMKILLFTPDNVFDPLQIFLRGEGNDKPAVALFGHFYIDFGAQEFRKLLDTLFYFLRYGGCSGGGAFFRTLLTQLPNNFFRFSNRQGIGQNSLVNFQLHLIVLDVNKGSSMSHGQETVPHTRLDYGVQF